MNSAELLGFIHFWGLSPAFNILKGEEVLTTNSNFLLSGVSDIRHLLKTCADNCLQDNELKLNFYFHEKQKEVLARIALQILVLCLDIGEREKMELFFDIHSNSMIKEKSVRFIDKAVKVLINTILEPEKAPKILTNLLDFSNLNFRDKDDLVEILESWKSKNPFDLEKLRDTRLRAHYKERYDFRSNLIDWDYQMGIIDEVPVLHFYHYKQWRQTGVAYEHRFSKYQHPNRTLSSYLPGRKKSTGTLCMLRGYWCDILISPYISIGADTDYEPEKSYFFKKRNTQYIGNTVDIAEFNLQYWIHILDTLQEFRTQQKNYAPIPNPGKDLIEEIKEEDENENFLNSDNSEDLKFKELQGLKKVECKVIFITEDIIKFSSKQKFQGFFDYSVFGFIHSGFIVKNDVCNLFKENSKVFYERARYLIPIKRDERKSLDELLSTKASEHNLKLIFEGDESLQRDHFHFKYSRNYKQEPELVEKEEEEK